MTAKLLIAVVAIGLSSFSALAQKSPNEEWSDLVAKAKGQKLVLAVHAFDGHAGTVREFQKRFPDIKVEFQEMAMSQLASRVVTEQRNGIYAWDATWGATQSLNSVLVPADGLAPITDYLVLPEVKDAANWRVPEKSLYTSAKGPYVFIHSMPISEPIFRNVDILKGFEITKAEQLLDPRLKGQISLCDATRQGNCAYSLAAIIKAYGSDLVRRLYAEQNLMIIENARQATDSIIRGSAAVNIGASPDVVFQCQQEGACKNIQKLQIGGHYVLARGVAVFKNAPNKEATKVWINWILSKEGQEVFVSEWAKKNEVGASSLRVDVEPDPKHLGSVPDYASVDQYMILGTDSGDSYLQQVVKIATEHTSK